jgi:hypothetical protein
MWTGSGLGLSTPDRPYSAHGAPFTLPPLAFGSDEDPSSISPRTRLNSGEESGILASNLTIGSPMLLSRLNSVRSGSTSSAGSSTDRTTGRSTDRSSNGSTSSGSVISTGSLDIPSIGLKSLYSDIASPISLQRLISARADSMRIDSMREIREFSRLPNHRDSLINEKSLKAVGCNMSQKDRVARAEEREMMMKQANINRDNAK